MEANPEKCQGIAVGKKGYDRKPTFNIKVADIECTDDVTLFGATIDYRMNFDKHISNMCKQCAVLENYCTSTTEKSLNFIFYLLLTFVQ